MTTFVSTVPCWHLNRFCCERGNVKTLLASWAVSVKRVKRSRAISLPDRISVRESSDLWTIRSGANSSGQAPEEKERKFKEGGIA
jgi:hypothetical protein